MTDVDVIELEVSATEDVLLDETELVAYQITHEDFAKLAAKDRDIVLFILLRSTLAEVQLMNRNAAIVMDVVAKLGTPDGIKTLMDKALESIDMGKMLGGMMGM